MFAAPPARGIALPAAGAPRLCSRALPRAAVLRWSCRSSALAGRSLQKVRFLLGAVSRFPWWLQTVSMTTEELDGSSRGRRRVVGFDCADF